MIVLVDELADVSFGMVAAVGNGAIVLVIMRTCVSNKILPIVYSILL